MTDIELLVDLFKDTERQGPGSNQDTEKALNMLRLSTGQPLQVADIGCGTGGQTICLAKHLFAHITAIDLFPEFLEVLRQKSNKLNNQSRIITKRQSMDKLNFEQQSLDLIWSEGAIYNIGFEKGIIDWKPFLKTGGHLAVSEITWTRQQRPREIDQYWRTVYPGIDTASNKISLLEKNGYSLVGYFDLPSKSWENYNQPLESKFSAFLERHGHSEAARNIVKENQAEIALHRKFKDYYSYGFYLAQKE